MIDADIILKTKQNERKIQKEEIQQITKKEKETYMVTLRRSMVICNRKKR